MNKREQNGLIERINVAHFPVFKELADFFSALPMLNKAQVLDLARGKYISKRVSIVFIGNPGLGKTHFALALALSACRQVPASQNVC